MFASDKLFASIDGKLFFKFSVDITVRVVIIVKTNRNRRECYFFSCDMSDL